MQVRHSRPEDHEAVAAFLTAHNAARVARRGELEDTLAHPQLIADETHLLGVLTYAVRGRECEVLTLHADRRHHGVGTALIEAAKALARGAGCTRLWLITTNDNVDALRFYQRRGFRLAKLHAGAVDYSRARLKPEIPHVGDHGIALRDELELDLEL